MKGVISWQEPGKDKLSVEKMWKSLNGNPVCTASGGVTISELCKTTAEKIIKDPTQSTLFIWRNDEKHVISILFIR